MAKPGVETRVRETLRGTELFSEVSDEVLDRAAARMSARRFADRDVIIHQGRPGTALHVVTSGSVEIRVRSKDGHTATVARLPSGECVGEMSLLTGDPASTDVVAVGEVETLALEADDFTRIVASSASLLRRFVEILSRRLSQTDVAAGEALGKEQDLTQFLREADQWDDDVVGKSPEARRLRTAIDAMAPGEAPVLVRGEEGTGRELVARMVQRRSPRGDEIVIGVDCDLIAESEWGDKLLGGRGGSVGGNRPLSYLELAAGGTLVLRDVERLPASVQLRLAHAMSGRGTASGVRLIATTGVVQGRGAITPTLFEAFGDRQIHVPPLRERKRDIPLLAEHYRAKHAERLGKPVIAIEDQALTALVSYDYELANDRELEEAIERAVILSDGDTIEAETIFLGRPPPPRTAAFNLLALPDIDVRRWMRVLPRVAQVGTVLFFAFLLWEAFFGPSQEEGNLATTLVWSLWWPALMLSFFFVGRAWCAVCPMGLATTATDRSDRKKKRRIPPWLKKHDISVAMAGLFLIVLVEETTGMRHSPVLTGLLLLAILGGAAVTGYLYPRRTWCRHVCPLGGMAGVCSTSGLIELRPTFDICSAKCTGHDCFKGTEHVPGCPMFNHVMFLDTNQDCVLCMNCLRACPNDSPQLNVRLPAREIWGGDAVRPGLGLFVLLLAGLLAAMTVVQHLERVDASWLHAHRFAVVFGLLVAGAAIPLLAARRLAEAARAKGPDEERRFWHRAASLVPLVTAGFVAYQLQYLPGLVWLNASIDYGGSDSVVSMPVLSIVRFAIVSAGLVTTAVILWRVDLQAPGDRESEDGPCVLPRRRDPLVLAGILGYWALLLALMLLP